MIIIIIIVIIIIMNFIMVSSVFSAEAQIKATEQKSNQINTSNHRLVFLRRRENLEHKEKTLSVQSREPTNSTHI